MKQTERNFWLDVSLFVTIYRQPSPGYSYGGSYPIATIQPSPGLTEPCGWRFM